MTPNSSSPIPEPSRTSFKVSTFGSGSPEEIQARVVNEAKTVDFETFKQIVLTEGYSPAVYEGTRNSQNFRGIPSFLVIDIDEGLSIEDAVARVSESGYAGVIATTRNHQKPKKSAGACDRFRVILWLSRSINTADEWKRTMRGAEAILGTGNDPSTTLYGLFFPSPQIAWARHPGSVLPDATPPKPFPVFDQAEAEKFWDEVTPDWKRFYIEGKGVLSKATRKFLLTGAASGMWNRTLAVAALDAKDQGYTEGEFSAWANRVEKPLDGSDLATISGVWNRRGVKPQPMRLPNDSVALSTEVIKRERKPKEVKGLHWRNIPTAKLRPFLDDLISKYFVQHNMNTQRIIYEVTDYEKQEIRICENEFIIGRQLHELSQKPESHWEGKQFTGPQLDEAWGFVGTALPEIPAPFKMPGETGWTLKKLTFDLRKGPYPAWEEFLSRLSDRRAFMAWVGACFDQTNKSRQAIYLWGHRGQDGKSRVGSVLSRCFGEAAGSINGSQLNTNSRFLFSGLFGKRFVLFADCKMPEFVKTEPFRNLTSGDFVPIEFKGQKPFNHELQVKLLICSNERPETSTRNADQSRLILLELAPPKIKEDPTWDAKLEAELGTFLCDCLEVYQKMCRIPGHFKDTIEVNERSLALLDESASDPEEVWEDIFTKFLVKLPSVEDQGVESLQLYSVLCGVRENGRPPITLKQLKEFKRYLKDNHGVDVRRVGAKRFYMGVKLAPGLESMMKVESNDKVSF